MKSSISDWEKKSRRQKWDRILLDFLTVENWPIQRIILNQQTMLHLFSNYYFLVRKYDLPSKYYSFPKALNFQKNCILVNLLVKEAHFSIKV